MLVFKIIEASYEKRNGFSEQTWCQFSIFTFIGFARELLTELPVLLIATLVLSLTKKLFFLACIGLTILVFIVYIWLYPLICMRCDNEFKPLPDDKD